MTETFDLIHWAQLFPGGGGGWWPHLMEKTRHRLIPVSMKNSARMSSWHDTLNTDGKWRKLIDLNRHHRSAAAMNIDGFLTHFPPLAAVSGLKHWRTPQKMLVCHNFNLGQTYGGLRRRIAQLALRNADKIIVHSTAEIRLYSEWLGLPEERFEFIHLQQAPLAEEDIPLPKNPYILAAGSANRDYHTLIDAVRTLDIHLIIVAGRFLLDSFRNLPPNVEVQTGLTLGQCATLLRNSIFQVVPLQDTPTASGQVAVVSGHRLARATIATRCPGTSDYIESGSNGILVDAYDPDGMRNAISLLLEDGQLRERMANQALKFWRQNLSDEAAFGSLIKVLDAVALSRSY